MPVPNHFEMIFNPDEMQEPCADLTEADFAKSVEELKEYAHTVDTLRSAFINYSNTLRTEEPRELHNQNLAHQVVCNEL